MSKSHGRTDDKSRGDRHRVFCLQCVTVTTHTVIASRNIEETFEDANFHRVDLDDYEILQCQNCESVLFRHAHRDTEDLDDDGEPSPTVIFYPPRRERRRLLTSLVGVPWPLKDTYEETAAALDEGKVRLTALGLRACIEQVCMDKAIQGNDLKAKIDQLESVGHITNDECQRLQLLRTDVGNLAAHDLFPPTQSQVDAGMAVLESLMHRLYLLPGEAGHLRRRPRP